MYGFSPYSLFSYCEPTVAITAFPMPVPATINVRQVQQFDFSVNLLASVLWQYNEADAIQSIIQSKQDWYTTNHTEFWNDWITDVFDLRTANDFGCAVWAIILDLPLSIEYDVSDGKNWGFGPYTGESLPNGAMNFDRGNFAPATVEVLPLTTDIKRLALQLRYFQLITRGDILSINAMFKRLFADYGPAYVVPNGSMALKYVFDFPISHPLLYLLNFYSLLPAPTGVAVTFVFI
jgi:hypothetical protein